MIISGVLTNELSNLYTCIGQEDKPTRLTKSDDLKVIIGDDGGENITTDSKKPPDDIEVEDKKGNEAI